MEPISTSAAVVAVGKAAAELVRMGYVKWDEDRKEARAAKNLLATILIHLRDEFARNDKSLRDAYNGSTDERLESQVYAACADALVLSLKGHSALLNAIRKPYQEITDGTQKKLQKHSSWETDGEDDLSELALLWCLIGTGCVEIDKFLTREGIQADKPTGADCKFLILGQLLVGWDPVFALRLTKRWKEFVQLASESAVRIYRCDEVQVVTMYHDPARERSLRSKAIQDWGNRYAFELQDGVFEYWFSAAVRVLFAKSAENLIVLDVVQLTGRDRDGWTPRWYVDRAKCRLLNR